LNSHHDGENGKANEDKKKPKDNNLCGKTSFDYQARKVAGTIKKTMARKRESQSLRASKALSSAMKISTFSGLLAGNLENMEEQGDERPAARTKVWL
jgi:hypothetical protein